MALFHLEVEVISRSKGGSITRKVSYILGKKMYDCYNHRLYYYPKTDVLYSAVFLPKQAPLNFYGAQEICNAVDRAEKRVDSRTAREFTASLPNELGKEELIRIVSDYVNEHFVANNLCAIVAIHEVKNKKDPSKNNPHVHIIVPTRFVEPEGFSLKKDREHNKQSYIKTWRDDWAEVQNKAYERNHLPMRVSSLSLKAQNIDREPTIHLSISDWKREERGVRTIAGDKNREIKAHNIERERQKQEEREKEQKRHHKHKR